MSELLKKEKNLVTIKLVVSSEEFEKACQNAYNKSKGKFNIQGFRKGKASRQIIEKMYGEGIFFEDAINAVFPDAFENAIKELDLDVIDRPSIDVEEIGKGKDLVLTVEALVKPDVTLGNYKGLEAEKTTVEVTDEEVDAELTKKQEENSRLVTVEDRTVAMNDTIIFDFDGYVDGVAFAGGKAEGYNLVIGSNSFIPGFEEQLVGAAIGEEKVVTVTFPEEYHSEELKGKTAEFKCLVNEIKYKELPVLDDEFVKDISEFDTLEELKADIKNKMIENKKTASENEFKNQLINQAVDNSEVEIPEVMVEGQTDRMIQEFSSNLQYQGLDLDTYLKYTGSNIEELKTQMKADAENRVKTSLVIEAIGKAEGITVSEDDLNEEYAKMAEMYKMEIEKVKEIFAAQDNEYLADTIKSRKTIDFITENGNIK